MAVPMFLNIWNKDHDNGPYLEYLYEADYTEFIEELSKKVPDLTKNSKVFMVEPLESFGEFIAKTREERLEQIQKYNESGMCDRMLDFLEKNPDYTVIDTMLGVAVKYITA